MSEVKETSIEVSHKRLTIISVVVLSVLLLLRFPFSLMCSYQVIPITPLTTSIFFDGTYFLTAVLIYLQRDSLAEHHMGFYSLIMFMLIPIVEYISNLLYPLSNKEPYFWIQIVISACLLVALLVRRPKLRKRKIKELLIWLVIAVVAGVGIGIFGGYMVSSPGTRSLMHPTVPYFVNSFFSQLGNAAIIEEPLFRGFLWGFLKKAHWKDIWIWLFQAALFMLGHIHYISYSNYSLFIFAAIGGLIIGLIAWRSRSIGPCTVTHGLANTTLDMVARFTW